MAVRLPAALRRTAGHRLALTATALTVLVASVLAAAAATFAGEVTSAAVRRSLTQKPSSTILVTQQIPAGGRPWPAGPGGGPADAAWRTGQGHRQPPFPDPESAGPAAPCPAGGRIAAVRIASGQPDHAAGVVSQTQLISLPGVTRQAVLTSGSWPGPAALAGGPVPVAVPAAAARLLRLAPGDRLVRRNDQTQAKIVVRVTGVFRPGPASPYWRLSPVGSAGVQRLDGFAVYGPLVTSPAVAAGPASRSPRVPGWRCRTSPWGPPEPAHWTCGTGCGWRWNPTTSRSGQTRRAGMRRGPVMGQVPVTRQTPVTRQVPVTRRARPWRLSCQRSGWLM